MLDDLDRIGPVLVMALIGALIIVWDFLPRGGPFPPSRGRRVMAFAMLGPVGAAAWALLLLLSDESGWSFANSVVLDDLSYFFVFLFCGVTAAVILSSEEHAKRFGNHEAEYYALVLLATSAMMLLANSRDIILIFVALEMTSITQYILAGLARDQRSTEAGMKYLLLGATASAVILYGMAYLFGLTGTTRLVAPDGELSIATAIAERGGDLQGGLIMASVFLIAGLGFKMSVVPFQMWTPDVYEGAPAPVAAFLSVASKAAGFAVVLRIFFEGMPDGSISADWSVIFAIIAAISMTVGNVFALTQTNIRRLLGYSSIAQAGNFMVGLAAIKADEGLSLGASGVLFFIAAYAFTNLAAFLAVVGISARTGSDEIASYSGLAKRAPFFAIVLGFAFISLTGIPPTAGFIAKLYIFNAAVQSDLIWLVIIAVLNSVISAFYYLRVTGLMFVGDAPSTERLGAPAALRFALVAAAAGIVVFGIYPAPLLDAARDAAAIFVQ